MTASVEAASGAVCILGMAVIVCQRKAASGEREDSVAEVA